MHKKLTFIAEDGTEFSTEDECRDHELELGAKLEAPAVLLAEIIRTLEESHPHAALRRTLAARLRAYLGNYPA